MKNILSFIVLFISSFALHAQTNIQEPTPLMKQRAAGFVKASHASEEFKSSVYVYYNRAIKKYPEHPHELTTRLAMLGFTDIYLGVTNNHLNGKDKKALEWIKEFNKAIHAHNIRVHAVRLTDNGLYRYPERIEEELKTFLHYNKTVEPGQQFDGISADLEPNTLRKGGNNIPQGFTTFWNDKEYGIGSNNEKLLKQSIDILQQARDSVGNDFPLSEAIGFQFQPRYDNGLLEYGSAKDFLGPCDHLIIMSYFNRKDAIWNRCMPLMESAKNKPKSIYAGIKTSLNTYGDAKADYIISLQPKGWAYLLETMDYLYKVSREYPAMRGICIFEYEGLEKMWESETDILPEALQVK